jgi:hypothetical protein
LLGLVFDRVTPEVLDPEPRRDELLQELVAPDGHDAANANGQAPAAVWDAELARNHRWYMTSRLVTLYDIYFFDGGPVPDRDIFTDLIGRHFRQPDKGLGFDGSPVAHMWRTMIWPNSFL